MEAKTFKGSKINLTMDFGITRMSSKGQIVIPQEMRKHIKKGEKLLIIEEKGQFIIKKASKHKQLEEDLEFARRTEEAYKRIEAGKGIKVSGKLSDEEFMKELDSW